MAERTAIEWCDATLNLWWGCTKVSDGCKHCYADAWSKRHGRAVWGPQGTRVEVKSWRSTLEKVSKRANAEGRRLRVFVQSMSDTFEGPETMGGRKSQNWDTVTRLQLELFAAMESHPELDFLLLTKRPENVVQQINDALGEVSPAVFAPSWCEYPHLLAAFLKDWIKGKAPSNVWIGTSVEDQKTADERIPHLLRIPAAVRFLSCEPLLGPVDLTRIEVVGPSWAKTSHCNALTVDDRGWASRPAHHRHVDWVICGGESGSQARPMALKWARDLRDQCQAAGVPFFFKQWGEFTPTVQFEAGNFVERELMCRRVGKKTAGRLLDGREWSEFPKEDSRGS